jgi:3-oxoacyl-(acyl-carrier-protein) synthase
MRRVVVTGLGVVSPAGIGKEALWKTVSTTRSMTKSLSSVTSSDLFGSFDFASGSVAEVPGFDGRARDLPREVQRLARFVQFAVVSVWDAMADAGLKPGQVDPERFGISLSTAVCGIPRIEEEFLRVTNYGKEPIDPSKAGRDLYLASMSNTPGLILASLLGAQGQCVTLSTGCIGGIDAVNNAYEAIGYGDADVMIAGASEAPITPITVSLFEIINCLSRKQKDQPEAASGPYDAERDGFVLGEGCGVVVLEELEYALRRGATPYMEIRAFSHTSNAVYRTDLLTDGADLAGLAPTDVDHVSSHGSSTPQNDSCETSTLKLVLDGHAYMIPVNSAKSMLGHALSAASAIEIVLRALACERASVHPIANYQNVDPQCDLHYVPDKKHPWDGTTVLQDASGFGGLPAALVMRAAPNGIASWTA